ncbi:hypothetical protein ACFVWN_11145 [Nocardiopsis flavescens]|uniref:hypothetical protein n=1 Tax=Nocardiopsis flavescens TaxID=758803 RepID=UPI0036674BFA
MNTIKKTLATAAATVALLGGGMAVAGPATAESTNGVRVTGSAQGEASAATTVEMGAVTLHGRRISLWRTINPGGAPTLHAGIRYGSPGDLVWLRSEHSSSRLHQRSIPAGASGVATPSVSTSVYYAACGKAHNRSDIRCTGFWI